MRISATQAFEADSNLLARWLAAVAKANTLSLFSTIELQRRVERLNILLFQLERDDQIRTINQNEAIHFQWAFYFVFFIYIVLLSISAAGITEPQSAEWFILPGFAVIFIIFTGKERCIKAAAEAIRRIEVAQHEFHELSGRRLRYGDLKLLQSESEDEENNLHLAEIIVESYEFVVERIWNLENRE